MKLKKCPIENCTNTMRYKSICSKHWYQIKKFGKPMTTMFDERELVEKEDHLEVPLWNKSGITGYALIDKKDRWIGERKWSLNKSGYALTTLNGRCVRMHRMLLNAKESEQVDHINGNRLDNRRSNLRLCTIAMNSYNRGKQANNTSGYKGVYRYGEKWRAKIVKNRKQYHLGTFDTPKEAAIAYDLGALKHFKDFAKLNLLER